MITSYLTNLVIIWRLYYITYIYIIYVHICTYVCIIYIDIDQSSHSNIVWLVGQLRIWLARSHLGLEVPTHQGTPRGSPASSPVGTPRIIQVIRFCLKNRSLAKSWSIWFINGLWQWFIDGLWLVYQWFVNGLSMVDRWFINMVYQWFVTMVCQIVIVQFHELSMGVYQLSWWPLLSS